jgi:hypothetical protein
MLPNHAAHRAVVVATVVLIVGCQDAAPPAAPVAPSDLAPSFQAGQAPQTAQPQVAAWFRQASPAVLSLPNTVFADHDEARGQLLFGVENAATIANVQATLSRLGIPSSAYTIRVTEPIVFAATLRERWRPTIGGVQIHFGRFLCTLGFNADDGAERSFITASHCTNRQGGVEGT